MLTESRNKDTFKYVISNLLQLVSCNLCNVAKMAVILAEAGIQKHRSSQKYWIPAPRLREDKLRGNDECLIRYFTHDTTLG